MKQTHKGWWLTLVILASLLAAALQDDPNTVFVRENETAKLQWSLFIGENAGRSSVNVRIEKKGLLCVWVKAHGEANQCDPGMNLTVSPEHVSVPGPTNITATFSFKNKGRVDDGTYECRFVIDGKWHEMQVYPRYLVTTVVPNVSLNATYNNTCITDIICHVRGGRPKPIETILIKNETEISHSRLTCPEEAVDTDGHGASYCSSVHSVKNTGGQFKCRVKHADYVVDSPEVDMPFGGKGPERNDCDCTGYNDAYFIPYIIMIMLMEMAIIVIMLRSVIMRSMFTAKKKRNNFVIETGIEVTNDSEGPVRPRTGTFSY